MWRWLSRYTEALKLKRETFPRCISEIDIVMRDCCGERILISSRLEPKGALFFFSFFFLICVRTVDEAKRVFGVVKQQRAQLAG